MANAERLPSSFKFNTTETVDSTFSKLVIANLFKDQTFKPGETFSDEVTEKAGQIYKRRLGKTAATVKDATSSGGLDLVHTSTEDSLVLIQKKDVVSRSEKCYELVETLRASGKSVDKVAEVLEEFKEGCQILYMSYLLAAPAEADAVVVGGAKRSANTTKSVDLKALTESILSDREQIKVDGGQADILLISPEMETLFLASAFTPGNAFIPETNEEMLKEGRIGRLYGLKVYTTNLIGGGAPTTTPVAGNAPANTGIAAKCEYVIYDHRAFAIAGDIIGLRMKDAIDFFGSYAQIEGIFGGGVSNPALAIAKVVEDAA